MRRYGLTVPPMRNDPAELEKLLQFIGPTVKQLRFCSDPRHCVCKTEHEKAKCPRATVDLEE